MLASKLTVPQGQQSVVPFYSVDVCLLIRVGTRVEPKYDVQIALGNFYLGYLT